MEAIFAGRFDDEFVGHMQLLDRCARQRRESMVIRNVVYGDPIRRQEGSDKGETFRFRGCERLHTLRRLLRKIDEGGYERSDHQLTFHAAFERCVARVLYKGEWTTQRVAIMKANDWTRSSSEVMVSTPRRFGKTFRCFADPFILAALAFPNTCCRLPAQHRYVRRGNGPFRQVRHRDLQPRSKGEQETARKSRRIHPRPRRRKEYNRM